MAIDKLNIINRALVATGNNAIDNILADEDEGVSARMAFDRAIDKLASEHQWPFVHVSAALADSGSAVPYGPWKYLMTYPSGIWHLRNVVDATYGNGQDYKLIRDGILTYRNDDLKAVYIQRPTTADAWHPAATEVLTLLCEAQLQRSLNDDWDKGDALEQKAEAMLLRAGSRVDQQSPPRRAYLSNVAQARRIRKI